MNVPPLSTSAGTDFTSIFSGCPSLCQAAFSGTATTISIANCSFTSSEIVNIFNNLSTVVGKTITIKPNWGSGSLSAADRLIATNKGWTITG